MIEVRKDGRRQGRRKTLLTLIITLGAALSLSVYVVETQGALGLQSQDLTQCSVRKGRLPGGGDL